MNNEMIIPFNFTIENKSGEPVMAYSAHALVVLDNSAEEREWQIENYFIQVKSEGGINVYDLIEDETVICFLAANEERFIDQVGATLDRRLETAA